VKISKPEIFQPIKFLPAKNSMSAKVSTSEAYRFWVTFFMIKTENLRAENFLSRIFFGLKILKSDFFWMRNFFVRKFLGQKIVRPEKWW
jgi:hypothetical protein